MKPAGIREPHLNRSTPVKQGLGAGIVVALRYRAPRRPGCRAREPSLHGPRRRRPPPVPAANPRAEGSRYYRGMQSGPGEAGPCSLFALVTYVPDPLGAYLDALRQELVPACNLRAHVTILPPRRLSIPAEAAWERIRSDARSYPAFEIALNDVEIFSISSVVYLGLTAGLKELVRLHDLLNTDGLHAAEAYPYHPHVTLAQNMAPEQVAGVFALARRRWAEYRGPRRFSADRVTFVRGETLDCWRDLEECILAPAK